MARLLVVCILLLIATTAPAQIVVEGITDKTDTNGVVTFRVAAEAGYTYSSQLDGAGIANDQWIAVRAIGYHQIDVARTNLAGGTQQTARVRFNIMDPVRLDAEWGIDTWNPYPPIESGPGEFAGASLRVIAPYRFPTNFVVPVITLVENADQSARRVNGGVSFGAFPASSAFLRRGAASALLPAQGVAGIVTSMVAAGGLSTGMVLRFDGPTAWAAATNINTTTTWTNQSRIRVASDITIAAGATLNINTGAIIRLLPGVDITVFGKLVVNGSSNEPVVFMGDDSTNVWGGLIVTQSAASVVINHAIVTSAGCVSNWMVARGLWIHRPEQAFIYAANGASVGLTNLFLINGMGQAFVGESNAVFRVDHCLFEKATCIGQFNTGCQLDIRRSWFMGVPSYTTNYADNDNDGIYLSQGALTIADSYIGWIKDDAIDAGQGPNAMIVMSNLWVEGAFHEGFALSSDGAEKTNYISRSVVMNCGQAIECGYGRPQAFITDSLFAANGVGFRFGDNYPDKQMLGYLQASNCFSLFNNRDVWNMVRITWLPSYSSTLILSNWLSRTYSDYSSNRLWSAADGYRLQGFLSPGQNTPGVGFHFSSAGGLATNAAYPVSVGLSLFSTTTVSVAYQVSGTAVSGADHGLTNGTITFLPGEMRKDLPLPLYGNPVAGPDKTIIVTLTSAAGLEVSSNQSAFVYTIPGDMWTAYNDCAWTAITNAGVNYGDAAGALCTTNGPHARVSGPLVNTNGLAIPGVQVSFASSALIQTDLLGAGASLPAGTDAEAVFAGHIGTNGTLHWTSNNVSMSFSGLTATRQYCVVIWSTRGGTSEQYSNRISEITISGADAFTNRSSIGTEWRTNAMPNDVTRVRSSLAPGLVARYDNINPGADGVVTFTMKPAADALYPLSSSSTNFYLNAFMIQATSAAAADADGDGMPDAWEVQYFGGTGAINGGAGQDYDGDGLENIDEYVAGTDPASAASTLRVLNSTNAWFPNMVRWNGTAQRTYDVRYRASLTTGNWLLLGSNIPSAYPAQNVYTDSLNLSATGGFYRIGVRAP